LTCSYCCKQYSSAWYKDIDQQGPYLDYENRYKLIPEDRLVRKISQHDLQESDTFQVLINEMTKLDQVERITVSGGEPFLYNQFPDLLNTFDRAPSVIFYTGLGVDHKRLAKQISRIHIRNNLQVVVSAENCGNLYEFNRYSNTYENFLRNLEILVSAGFNITFNSVLSNLTLFGILEFAETFSQYPITYSFCNTPDFLAVNVLDDSSKSVLIDLFNQVRISESDLLISSLQQPCTDTQKKQFAQFLIEFSRRRNLSLDIFPTSMLKWLEI
jgi:molybdenum cofactor biosynthesis enzyme MoaA